MLTNNTKTLYKEFSQTNRFFKREVRACCYTHALRLINKAKKGKTFYKSDLTIDAIILLLFSWNFAAPITKKLTRKKIKNVIMKNINLLKSVEDLNIVNIDLEENKQIKKVFNNFRKVFGQTGASKVLSLLNTKLFVMWDTKIRKGMGKYITNIGDGKKGNNYFNYLKGIQRIIMVENLLKFSNENSIAKMIDEYHYCKFNSK